MNKNEQLLEKSSLIQNRSANIRSFIASLFDENSFVELNAFQSGVGFASGEEALGEGVLTGYATIGGKSVYFYAHNPEVYKGSLSIAHAKKILNCIDKALKTNTPFISVINSAGARIEEGGSVLEGYSALIDAALDMKGSVPHIAVINGTCVGLTSVYAALADFVFAGESASVSFNAPMSVAAKEGKSAEAKDVFGVKSAASPMISFTYSGVQDLRSQLAALINVIDNDFVSVQDDPNRVTEALNTDSSVPTLLAAVADNASYIEYNACFAKEAVCAFASINELPVGILLNNSAVSDFLSADALEKITAFAGVLQKFDLPLICMVNSKGVASNVVAENAGLYRKLADMYSALSSVNTKLSVIVGNAIGVAYSAFAAKGSGFDYTLATTSAVISPILPETATVLYADELKAAADPIAARAKVEKAYCENVANPFITAKEGYVDNVVEASAIRPYLANALIMALGL